MFQKLAGIVSMLFPTALLVAGMSPSEIGIGWILPIVGIGLVLVPEIKEN